MIYVHINFDDYHHHRTILKAFPDNTTVGQCIEDFLGYDQYNNHKNEYFVDGSILSECIVNIPVTIARLHDTDGTYTINIMTMAEYSYRANNFQKMIRGELLNER